MKKSLKFIRGAVSKSDAQPVLKHVYIKDGRALAFNGAIALSSPIDLAHDVTPYST